MEGKDTTNAHGGRIGTRERLQVVEHSLRSRIKRVRSRFPYIVQATVGAGLAYWVAHELVGHPQPFFAPIAVVIILGLSGGDRLSRAFEMALGGVMGVAVGDLLFHTTGSGPLQITMLVFIALIVGSLLTKSVLVSNQIVIGSILIATIMPPNAEVGGLERAIDAMIGSIIGIITIALLPNSPLTNGRNEISKVLAIISSVLADVVDGLRANDHAIIDHAMDAVSDSQTDINKMLAAAKSGKETTNVSPLMWGSRRQMRSFERLLEPVDNCVRLVQVLARRAGVLCEDGDKVSEKQIDLLAELSDIALSLSAVYEKNTKVIEAQEIPVLINRLRTVAAESGTEVLGKKSVLSAYAILAQTRSVAVDLMIVCGMSRESAVAQLQPTSSNPAFPPEV
ncbi:aromatic acid exporter family protein [Corynebacterium sp. L4756]|uniref:FUSC family protein n=1 Tax=unclassified Corynebacterium TaxID=2624378 RepID=UPI00374CDDBE